jgi:hypothetical protein
VLAADIIVFIKPCSDFSASALDILNVDEIEVVGSLFQNCTSSNGSKRFRANSGAVSIGYNRDEDYSSDGDNLSLTISDCKFIGNRALLPDIGTDEINIALNFNLYYGRGGGLSIVPQGYYTNLTALIANTTFEGNWADAFGGAVFLLLSTIETVHDVRFEGCTFLRNSGGSASFGGGIQVAFLLRNLQAGPSTVYISDSRFEENFANFGGGLSSVQVRVHSWFRHIVPC